MKKHDKKIPRVVIVGSGISGLVTAFTLQNLVRKNNKLVEILIFEKANKIGGSISSTSNFESMIEHGADALYLHKDKHKQVVEWLKMLDLDKEFVYPSLENRSISVFRKHEIMDIPHGFELFFPTRLVPFLKTPMVSLVGKFKMISNLFFSKKKNSSEEDQSIESFAIENCGMEMYKKIIAPVIQSIYPFPLKELSMNLLFPYFSEQVKQGDILKNIFSLKTSPASVSGSNRYGNFISFRNGLSSLISCLYSKIDDHVTKRRMHVTKVSYIKDTDKQSIDSHASRKFLLQTREIDVYSDAVCFALPLSQTNTILQTTYPRISKIISSIPHASVVIVNLIYNKQKIKNLRLLNRYGIVIPEESDIRVSGVSFYSSKFPQHTSDKFVHLRVFFLGKKAVKVIGLPVLQIEEIAQSSVQSIFKLDTSLQSLYSKVSKYPDVIPGYRLTEHLQSMTHLKKQLHVNKGLYMCGNGLHGIGIPECITSAINVAQDIYRGLFE